MADSNRVTWVKPSNSMKFYLASSYKIIHATLETVFNGDNISIVRFLGTIHEKREHILFALLKRST